MRQYEFLKLYLVPERSGVEKDKNAETLRTANAYKAQKIVELQNGEFGFSNARLRCQMNFVDYMRSLSKKAKERGTSTYQTYDNGINHFIKYAGDQVEIGSIDKEFCMGFVSYLKRAKTLPPSSFPERGRTTAWRLQSAATTPSLPLHPRPTRPR